MVYAAVTKLFREISGFENFSEYSTLEEDLALDSLDMVDFLIHAEDELGTEIPDDALADCRTVGDVIVRLEGITQPLLSTRPYRFVL